MMKKLITAMLIVTLILVTPAFALAQSVQLNVEINAFTINISGTLASAAKRVSIQMLNKNRTIVIYTGETNVVNTGNAYTFQFENFNISEDTLTDEYIIRVGGKDIPITEKVFNFANINDRKNALIAINNTQKDQIKSVLTLYTTLLEIDITKYLSLSNIWQGKIDEIVSNLDLTINPEGTNVIEKQQLLKTEFAKNVESASICQETDLAKLAALIETSTNLGLDKALSYNELKLINNQNEVLTNFINYDFEAINGIDGVMINNQFDGSVLITVINKLDWGKVEVALKYYETKGLLTLDYSAFNKLESDRKSDVYKDLKKVNFNDYSQIPAEFKKISDKYIPTTTGPTGGGGGTSVITVSPQTPVETQKPNLQSFSDMGSTAWAKESVEYLSAKGVLNGKGDGKFYPNDSVTREEFVKIIVLAFDLFDENATVSFKDVNKSDWYYPYVASAKKTGIITGINDSDFGVGNVIVRQDMAVIISRIYKMAGSKAVVKQNSEFSDYSSISDYAKEAVKELNSAGIVSGTGNGNFSPFDKVTRAQSAKIAYELIKFIGGDVL